MQGKKESKNLILIPYSIFRIMYFCNMQAPNQAFKTSRRSRRGTMTLKKEDLDKRVKSAKAEKQLCVYQRLATI